MPRFTNKMCSLLEKGPTWDVEEERLQLIRKVEQMVISLHNSEATDEGVEVLREACRCWRSDSDVELLHKSICTDFDIDAFGNNPDIGLAKFKYLVEPGRDLPATISTMEKFREILAAPKVQRFAVREEMRARLAMRKEAVQHAVDLEKQHNSPRAFAVALCCRG